MKVSKTAAFILLVLFLQLISFAAYGNDKTYVISYSPGTLFHELVRDRTKALYEKAGLTAEFVALPHKRSLFSANEGTVDGDVGRVPSVQENYPNLRRVNVKLMDLNGVVYTTRDEITSYDDALLKQYRVGYIRGVQWTEKKMQGLEATKVDSYSILFTMLLQGRIDIILATEISANSAIRNLGEKVSIIRKLDPFIFSAPIYHYVNKKNEAIIPRLEKAVTALIEEGYWDQ